MLTDLILSPAAFGFLAIGLVAYYMVPYLTNRALIDIPGPFLAAISNLWVLIQARKGRRFLEVDALHEKLGPFVRIQPNHVSIADTGAIHTIYGHGNGFLKSEFYDAFVSIRRGLFNTRDRADHTRKRKIVSHTFSAKSVLQFEQYMHHNLEEFVRQMDRIAASARKGGYAEIDALNWFNYLAFDVIGDLSFGAPFGMLTKGQDIAEVQTTPSSKPTYAPAVQVLNRRGEVSAALGVFTALRPYAKYLPDAFFSKGMEAIENLAGIAISRVNQRLKNPSDRVDLLARLMEGRDQAGKPLGREELTAEALTQLIAGSDTTSNTNTAILFHCLSNPYVVKKLRKELDSALPPDQRVPNFSQIKDLPYLESVIKETLRIHSTAAIGLPRDVPAGGITITLSDYAHDMPGGTKGKKVSHFFPAGTTLSVPGYTIHHSKKVWGPDADQFRPERWLASEDGETTGACGSGLSQVQKNSFIPFSYGPRACVGRNVAEMEMALTIATALRQWDWELHQDVMETREGFLRKPLGLMVGIKKRAV